MREQAEGQIKRDQEFPAPPAPCRVHGSICQRLRVLMASGPGGSGGCRSCRGHCQGLGRGPATASLLHRGTDSSRDPGTSPAQLPDLSSQPCYLAASTSRPPAPPALHTQIASDGAFTHWHKNLVPTPLNHRSTPVCSELSAQAPCLWQPPAPTFSLTCCGWEKQKIPLSKTEARS